MKSFQRISTYIIAIIGIIALIIFSWFYRYNGTLYRIQRYNFKSEQEKILKFTDEDFIVLDSLRIIRNIYSRDSLVKLIRDSLLEAKKTPENIYLSSLPIDKFAEETKKDRLFKSNDSSTINLLRTVAIISYIDSLPKDLQSKTDENASYDPFLFFKEDELPSEITKYDFKPQEVYFFLPEGSNGYCVKIEKLTNLYSQDEALDEHFKSNYVASIPDAILFPYRKYIIYLIALLFIVLFSPYYLYVFRTLSSANKEENFQRKFAIMWIAILLISIFGAISVPLFDISISKGGGALFFISLIVAVTAFFISLLYLKRTKLLTQMLNQENTLVKWIYPEDVWQKYLDFAYQERKKQNRNTYILVATVLIIIFSIFMIFDNKSFPIMLYILIGFLLLLFIISKASPAAEYKKQLKAKPLAIISKNGVLIGKYLHNWNSFNSRFEGAKCEIEEFPRLEVTYSYMSRYNRQYQTVKIPIPQGQENQAEFIAEQMNKLNKIKNN